MEKVFDVGAVMEAIVPRLFGGESLNVPIVVE